MPERRVDLIEDYAISNATFLVRFPVGGPEKEERLTRTFVLYQASNGDFFYCDMRPESTHQPFEGQKFESGEEALHWFDEQFKWVRLLLEQDSPSIREDDPLSEDRAFRGESGMGHEHVQLLAARLSAQTHQFIGSRPSPSL